MMKLNQAVPYLWDSFSTFKCLNLLKNHIIIFCLYSIINSFEKLLYEKKHGSTPVVSVFIFLLYIHPIKIYYLVVILCEKSINNMYSPLLVIKC